MKYPVTCKIDNLSCPGYPKMLSLEECQQPGKFEAAAVVDVIGPGGIRVAYKDSGQTSLTIGPRAS